MTQSKWKLCDEYLNVKWVANEMNNTFYGNRLNNLIQIAEKQHNFEIWKDNIDDIN